MMVKCSRLLYFASLSGLVYTVLSCVATSGSGSTTVTTTTSATVTTTATPSCTSCTASQVTFAQASGTIGIDTSGVVGTDDTGCLTLTATCTAATGFYAFMQFNNNQGGPAENANMGRTINAVLNCVNGNWVYTSGGVSRIVTQVSCNQAPDTG